MKQSAVWLIARNFWSTTFKTKSIYAALIVFGILVMFAAVTGYKAYSVQNEIRRSYQHQARESWEANPDKHPHRMAHFGTFAFRTRHALSLFDFGMESFTGNAVFLEAHKQNSVNFSEASLSTGLLRLGEISIAMLLQVVLPLIVFFIGFGAVAAEREAGTLKLLLVQGAGWRSVLLGKSIGLMAVTMVFYLPVLLTTGVLAGFATGSTSDLWPRFLLIGLLYLCFYWVMSVMAVAVSTLSRSSKDGLIRLLGIWLLLAVLMPKAMQSLGNAIYPSPTRLEFDGAVEADLIRTGDSHNPDDPFFTSFKDSVLKANGADSVQQLPFNYGGLVMQQGERISAELYNQHQARLNATYRKQNRVAAATAFINPFTVVREVSMALSATDFASYERFQQEAEAYRYQLAQHMNELQIKFIPNRKGLPGRPLQIGRSHWASFPDFKPGSLNTGAVLRASWPVLLALALWTMLSFGALTLLSTKAKAV